MSCVVCDSTIDASKGYCVICGRVPSSTGEIEWNRSVESEAYHDLCETLCEGESLLAFTRGKTMGAWKHSFSLHPHAMLSSHINLGLLSDSFVVQKIHAVNGRALHQDATRVLFSSIRSLNETDADPLTSGLTCRLEFGLQNGETMRIRASGRMAKNASKMAEIFNSLSTKNGFDEVGSGVICTACERALDNIYQFCPFCGKNQREG